MFANKLTKKNEKRVSLSVLAASKSVRRSIKFVNKQSKFHLSCHNKVLQKAVTKPQRMEIQSYLEEKSKIEPNNNINICGAAKTPSGNKISLKERITMSSNRLATNKHPVEPIRQRNQFNTPNTAKRPNSTNINNEHLNKRFNSAHVNFNANSTSSANTKSTIMVQRKLFTPSVNAVQTPRIKTAQRIASITKNTPSLNTKTPTNKFSNIFSSNINSAKSVNASSKNNIDRAKSSVRRSIQLLNNNLKTPTTSNYRRNLFQSGSKIPLYTPNSKQYPKTEERKPTQSKISEQLKNLTKTTEIKTRRRSSRFSGRLSDIESSCLILTPKLMRQLLTKASESTNKADDINKIVEEDEEEEPIKVKTIKPSSLIKYLFSEKQKLYDAEALKEKLNKEESKKNDANDSTKEIHENIMKEENSILSETNPTKNVDCTEAANVIKANIEDQINTVNTLNDSNGRDEKSKTDAQNEEKKLSTCKNEIIVETNSQKECKELNPTSNQSKDEACQLQKNILNEDKININTYKESIQELDQNDVIPDNQSNRNLIEESDRNTEKTEKEEAILANELEIFSTEINNQNTQEILKIKDLLNQEPTNEKAFIKKTNELTETKEELNILEEHTSNEIQTSDICDIELIKRDDKYANESNPEIITNENRIITTRAENNDEDTQITCQDAGKIERIEKSIPDNFEILESNGNLSEKQNDENQIVNTLHEKVMTDTSNTTSNIKKHNYTKKNVQKVENDESFIQNQENIPAETTKMPENNQEDYSIGITIEIQTDFDENEKNNEENFKVIETLEPKVVEEEVTVASTKATRKKRERKNVAKLEQPLEEIANEGRVLTRAQRAKLNKKA